MPLVERDRFMEALQQQFETILSGEGHCVLLSGEAGIGKSALVKSFCKERSGQCTVYHGACDALFTPRPLAPLYDVLWQVNPARWPEPPVQEERSLLFANFFQELTAKRGRLVLVFEDIHWADEGTMDFIKFFVRRIENLPCLFILTYRDNEIHSRHPLRNVLGQLPPDSFTKITLAPLSKEAVVEMATRKGYNGDEVYRISGGIPFYVNEILASYSPGVPDNIKDSILAVYDRQDEGTRNAWQIFSVIPEGLEVDRFAMLKSSTDAAVNHCFTIAVIVVQNNKIVFKHELYRRTIEESLTPLRRVELNKLVLDLFGKSFEEKGETERLLHYAKNSHENELVLRYAPEAARKAASKGAHRQAAQLFLTSIEHCDADQPAQLIGLYEAYGYECYLSNQIQEAILYTEKALAIHQQAGDVEQTGKSLQFLSRLWWFAGNKIRAERFAWESIEVLNDQPASSIKAMALSNVSQLKMLADQHAESITWGQQAIEMAREVQNDQILSHALNNVGTSQFFTRSLEETGLATLQQSLDIALQNGYEEHAARAYTNMAAILVKKRNYPLAEKKLDEGIPYCEERDLDSWTSYMLSWKARLKFETGNWTVAGNIAERLLTHGTQPAITRITAATVMARINMRRGEENVVPLLQDARAIAFETMELQRIIPLIVACLEYEWLTGKSILEETDISQVKGLMGECGIEAEKNEFTFWMIKAGRIKTAPGSPSPSFDTSTPDKMAAAAAYWSDAGCPYEEALVRFEGNADDKKKAIAMILDLDAGVVAEKMKQEMRTLGIKNIPRGIRSSTRANGAFLTAREMDILVLLKKELANREIAAQLYISPKTVDHHISSILFKLDSESRTKAVTEAVRMGILK